MKKVVLFVTVAILSLSIKAQIPNPGFETWNATNFDQLNNWITFGSASKATPGQQGSSALKLTSDATNFYGGASNGTSNFPDGGNPCGQRPDSLIGFFKCNLLNNDSAQIMLVFKKAGNIIAFNSYTIGGVNTTTYKRLAFYIDYFLPAVVPDTVVIQIFSTDFNNTQVGNYIIVDNLQLTKAGTAIPSQMVNNSFENWTAQSFKEPSGWVTSNQLYFMFVGGTNFPITQSTSVHAGTSAIRLENIDAGFSGIMPGVAITGADIFSVGLDIPSFPLNFRSPKLTGFYKYTAVGGDSAFIDVSVFKNGAIVGQGSFQQGTTVSAYTPFTCFITYDGTFTGNPDSASIQVSACNTNNVQGAGAVLYVDDLAFAAPGAGLNDANKTGSNHIAVMPNPFNEHFVIQYEVPIAGNINISIMDINGKVVKEIKKENARPGIYQDEVDLSTQSAGIYFYQCMIGNSISSGKIIKQ